MRASRKVVVGGVPVGGGAPVTVQSMLNIPAERMAEAVGQAKKLADAGCEILRAAVPDEKSVALIPAVKRAVSIPVVADIHFDYRLAIAAAAAGADAIRINPGNIGSEDRVRAVAEACRSRGLPIRIGVNSGSVEKKVLEKYGGPTPCALVESALNHASLLEKTGFRDIVLSIKSSDVETTIRANEIAARECDYPLHLGVTEAGTERTGIVRSAIGIGSLLREGIGDTIRVSLTADPLREVQAGVDILKALGLRGGVKIISCPTCGRTKIDLISLASKVEKRLADCRKPITVAVMGCAVNGPGEAREADVGIAGGDGCGLIFRKGVVVRRVPESELLSGLMQEIENL